MSGMLNLTDTEALVIRAVARKGGRVWAVGGCIRDLLLQQKPKDIDLVTDLPPPLSSGAMAERGLKVIDDKTAWSHGIIRIATYQGIIDLATLRKDTCCDGRHAEVEFADSIEEDLWRRDLTINALAAEIDEEGNLGEIIDVSGGLQDIRNSTIRFVGEPTERINEDFLRMVRAARFTALGKKWHTESLSLRAIRELNEHINEVSQERIRDEIVKALQYPMPSQFFRTLHAGKLLGHICRPVADTVGVEQNEYHAETVFDHLMFTVDASVEFTDNVLLRLAALLHDVGKPGTKSTGEDGRVHFYKHEVQGMIIADNWMKSLKFSNKEREYVTRLVRNHQWRFQADSKDKTIRKWLRDVGEDWRDLVTLRACDRKGNLAKAGKSAVTKHMRELIERAENILQKGDPIFNSDLAINGNDLKALGIKPGPIYQQIFQDAWALVINEPHRNTKEELLEIVRRKHVG